MNKREWLRLYNKYGAHVLSSVFGVPQPTVRRWASVGLPKTRWAVAERLEQIRQHEGYEQKALREMMALAKEQGELPKVKRYERPRDAQKTTGYEVSIPGKGFLNDASILQISSELQAASLARGLPVFLASVTVSALVTDSEKAGSADTRIQVDHPDANDFVVESIISSGIQHSRRAMIDSLVSKLREKARDSGDAYYVHGVYATAYQYKNEAEQRALASFKRRQRKLKHEA